MRIPQRLPGVLLLVGILAFAVTSASAASLYGKVTEIDDGDLFTIINLNRTIKIRLSGVDAPEPGQPYADVARQHLSDLVRYKEVVIQYSGLAQHNYILGKVFVRDQDIGAQMIRDGVAWFDPSGTNRLSQADQETYAANEQVARSERRGIWKDESPVAPWNFKGSAALKPVVVSAATTRTTRPSKGLSSDDLLGAMSGGEFPPGPLSESSTSWRTLTPEGFNFSIKVPSNAIEAGAFLPTYRGETLDSNVALGRYGNIVYQVVWIKGPSDGRSDSVLIGDTVDSFIDKYNKNLAQLGRETVSVTRQRSLKVGTTVGIQYKVSSHGIPGVMRVFTRHNVNEREVYVLQVVNGTEDHPEVGEFFNSLSFTRK
ncbi:MAG: thermonuclease family protein [Pyrinomonadaceae bacterium]